jgi:hypothetical protein
MHHPSYLILGQKFAENTIIAGLKTFSAGLGEGNGCANEILSLFSRSYSKDNDQ